MSSLTGMTGMTGAEAAVNTPLVADALIRTRDGIAGTWRPPAPQRNPDVGRPDHLARWSPDMRAIIYEGEVLSRLAFSDDGASSAFIWHLQAGASTPSALWSTPPTPSHSPLVAVTRPTDHIFNKQLDLVVGYADLRPDRVSEIVAQLGDPFAFMGSIVNIHPQRMRWTLELLTLALKLANIGVQRMKHALACRRPSDLSPQIQPIIQVPGHASLPSGHANEAFVAAIVLYEVLRSCRRADTSTGVQLMRLASRIAINRTVAGVHFPVDSVAGAVCGLTLGKYLVSRATGGQTYQAWHFDGMQFPADRDFDWKRQYDLRTNTQTAAENFVAGPAVQSDSRLASPILNWLWEKARSEW